ncbi:MAG: TetR/AcrR family transcriptional regulator [Myxococcales bacterium]|nr:TetR/AcrR family transcriptional regulator [Myxococcales bacterium]
MTSAAKKKKPARARPPERGEPEPPREARRERKRTLAREEILEATRRVIAKKGMPITLDAVAKEVGLTKAALYYYYRSKDALMFELVYRIFERDTHLVGAAVAAQRSGKDALAALLRTIISGYAQSMDDFRLVFLQGQVAGPEAMKMLPEYFERIRPLNGVMYGGTTQKLEEDLGGHETRSGVPPRRLAFLAHMAAIGVLTMKGMVESVGDPLLYSDETLIDDLSRIFAVAAEKRR